MMNSIILDPQGAFVAGWQILDGVLIANECLDDWLKWSRNWILVKLELEKAYDHVNWMFLDYMLGRSGFVSRWRNWVYVSIGSVVFSVLVNGVMEGFFRSSCSLRQGDPFPPTSLW